MTSTTLHNIPTWYDGYLYQSKAEAHRAQDLDKEKKQGPVKWWLRQVRFEVRDVNGDSYTIVVDFLVMRDREIVEEVKNGLITPEFIRKSQLWLKQFPNFPYDVLEPEGNGWKRTPLAEFIKPYLHAQPESEPMQHSKWAVWFGWFVHWLGKKLIK
jgi:hypothetical protein